MDNRKNRGGNQGGGHGFHRPQTKSEQDTPEEKLFENGNERCRGDNPKNPDERHALFQSVNFKAHVSHTQQENRNESDSDPNEKVAPAERIGFDPEFPKPSDSDPPKCRPEGDEHGNLQATAEIPMEWETPQKWKDSVVRERAPGPIQGRGQKAGDQGDDCQAEQQPQEIGFHVQKCMIEFPFGCETFGESDAGGICRRNF